MRLAGVPTDDSMTPDDAGPANGDASQRAHAGRAPEDGGRTGRLASQRAHTGQLCANVGQSCGRSGELPDDRQARRQRARGGGDPAQGASYPERAGDGPAASSQASHREDPCQPPGGGALAGGGTGHAPEDRETSSPDALAERHARERVDRRGRESGAVEAATWVMLEGFTAGSLPR